jgi:predicted phosphoribosyltransferase
MYFASRVQAGRMLAAQMVGKYRYKNCVVMAVNDGGVMVGAQIAQQLHCALTLMLSAEINLPREPDAIAGITSEGSLAYNHKYSTGEIDEMMLEYRGLVEQEKLTQMHDMNTLLGKGGTIKKEFLKGHNVIIVADGLINSFPLDLAYEFLKPINIESLIIAVPLASVQAVDRMHVLVDDIYCLSVIAEYIDTAHYYDKQDIPDRQTIVDTVEKIIVNWQ